MLINGFLNLHPILILLLILVFLKNFNLTFFYFNINNILNILKKLIFCLKLIILIIILGSHWAIQEQNSLHNFVEIIDDNYLIFILIVFFYFKICFFIKSYILIFMCIHIIYVILVYTINFFFKINLLFPLLEVKNYIILSSIFFFNKNVKHLFIFLFFLFFLNNSNILYIFYNFFVNIYVNDQLILILENFFFKNFEFFEINIYYNNNIDNNISILMNFFYINLLVFFSEFIFNIHNIYYVYILVFLNIFNITFFLKIKPLF